GDPLSAQLPIACKQVSALETRPALVAIMIATVLFLDYRCHRLPPRPKLLPCAKWRAKDGEVAPWLQSFSVASQVFSRSPSRRDGRRGDQGRIGVDEIPVAVPKGREAGMAYVRQFIEDAKAQDLVKAAVQRAGLRGAVEA